MKSIIKIFVLIFALSFLGCNGEDSGNLHGKMPCGGTANFRCPNTMYCELKENCGGYDSEGICKPRPQSCPPEVKPICGCNQQT